MFPLLPFELPKMEGNGNEGGNNVNPSEVLNQVKDSLAYLEAFTQQMVKMQNNNMHYHALVTDILTQGLAAA